jgi:hypothetical protein
MVRTKRNKTVVTKAITAVVTNRMTLQPCTTDTNNNNNIIRNKTNKVNLESLSSPSSFTSASTFHTQPELNHLFQEMKQNQTLQSSRSQKRKANALMDSTNHCISSSSRNQTKQKTMIKSTSQTKTGTTPRTSSQMYNNTPGKTPKMNNLASSTIFSSNEWKRMIPHYRKVIDIHPDTSPDPSCPITVPTKQEHKEYHKQMDKPSSSSSMDCSSPVEGEMSDLEQEVNAIPTFTKERKEWASPIVKASTTTVAKDDVHGMDILDYCVNSRGEPHITKGILRRIVHTPADNKHILKKMLDSCGGGKTGGTMHHGMDKKETNKKQNDMDDSVMHVLGSTLDIRRTTSIDSVGSSVTQGTLNEEEKKYTLALLKRTNIVLQDEDVISQCKDTGMILVHQELPSGWVVGFSSKRNVPVYAHPDYGRSLHMPVVQTRSINVYDHKGNLCVTYTKTPFSKQLDVEGATSKVATFDPNQISTLTQNDVEESSSCGSTSNGSILVRQIASRRKSSNAVVLKDDLRARKDAQSSNDIPTPNNDAQISSQSIHSDIAVDYHDRSEESHLSNESMIKLNDVDTGSSVDSTQSQKCEVLDQNPEFETFDEASDGSNDDSTRSSNNPRSIGGPSCTPASSSSRPFLYDLHTDARTSENGFDSVLDNSHDQSNKSSEGSCSPVSKIRLDGDQNTFGRFSSSRALTERLSMILHPICSLQRLDAIIAENKKVWLANRRNRRKTLSDSKKKTIGQLSGKLKKRNSITPDVHIAQK